MKKVNYVRSSGNVFADLELPDAEERLLKAQLAVLRAGLSRYLCPCSASAAAPLIRTQYVPVPYLKGVRCGMTVCRLASLMCTTSRPVVPELSACAPSQ
jgi:hypothetical protein